MNQFANKSELDGIGQQLNQTFEKVIIINKTVNAVDKHGSIVDKELDTLRRDVKGIKEDDSLNKTIKELDVIGQKLNQTSEKVAIINKTADEQSSKIGNELDILRNDVKGIKEDDSLKKRIQELEHKIKDVDINREEASFIFESNNITKFLQSEAANKPRLSEFFYCRGLAWDLDIRIIVKESKRYLGIYLGVNNPNDSSNWHINTNYQITILNSRPDKNKIEKTDKVFNKTIGSWGWPEFASVDEIINGRFIQNDTIRIKIDLKADKLIRDGS